MIQTIFINISLEYVSHWMLLIQNRPYYLATCLYIWSCSFSLQVAWYAIKYILLSWEPRVAQVTYSYSCRLPALGRFYQEAKFSKKNVDPLNRISKLYQAPQLLSYDRTNKQTDKQRLQLYKCRMVLGM